MASTRKNKDFNPYNCPVTHCMNLIGGKWKILIIYAISRNCNRFGKLQKALPLISKQMLVNQLRELEVINTIDAYGKVPLVKIVIKGHIVWQGEHPIASGAQKVDFMADTAYQVTPLHQAFADAMNHIANNGFNQWEVNNMQSVMGKAFAPFGLTEGDVYAEYDLIYLYNDLLFWGAKHVDGRGFDKLENRPDNLQIPLKRAE